MTREVEGVGQETFDNPSPSAQISRQKKKNSVQRNLKETEMIFKCFGTKIKNTD